MPFLVAMGQIPMSEKHFQRRISSIVPLSAYREEAMDRGGRENIGLGVLPLMSFGVLGELFYIPGPSFIICKMKSVSYL